MSQVNIKNLHSKSFSKIDQEDLSSKSSSKTNSTNASFEDSNVSKKTNNGVWKFLGKAGKVASSAFARVVRAVIGAPLAVPAYIYNIKTIVNISKRVGAYQEVIGEKSKTAATITTFLKTSGNFLTGGINAPKPLRDWSALRYSPFNAFFAGECLKYATMTQSTQNNIANNIKASIVTF